MENLKKYQLLLCLSLLFFVFFVPANGQNTNFPQGSFIINTGVSPQTVANGLKPYGMVYDLVKNYNVPVYWSINPNKLKDGTDFLYRGNVYKGGPFIISAEYRNATVDARIAYWQSQGVIGLYTDTILTAPVAQLITAVPRWTLDAQSGNIANGYLSNAGIPAASASFADPSMLTACNDIFVMPHADPTWNSHQGLINWNNTSKGAIWVSCHAGSVLENMYNTSSPSQQANFLALNSAGPGSQSLVPFGSHRDGSLPYNNNSYPADQVMQFLGSIDAATTNGSEQIYLPSLGGGWRPSTKIGVYDPTQSDIPTLSLGKAAVLAYGKAYGDNNRGWVMYEGGHNIDGNSESCVAAQRAFLNFSFMAAIDKGINLTTSGIQSVMVSNTVYNFSVAISQAVSSAPYTIQWSSNCTGTFSNPTASSTTFTPAIVASPTQCIISVKVTDNCGRSRFYSQPVLITSGPRPPVAAPDSVYYYPDCNNIIPSITVNVLNNDYEPDGQPITLSSISGSNGTWSINPDKTINFVPSTGFYGSTTANYTICDNTSPSPLCASSTVKVSVGSSGQAPTAVTDSFLIYEDSIQRFNVLANDLAGSGNLKVIGIPIGPKNGKVSINTDYTITYLPNADYNGLDSFYYKISSTSGYLSTGMVYITIRHDCCSPGNYKRVLGPVLTTTQNLTATDDGYIMLKSANTNFGTSQTMIADRETTDKQLGVVNFDLSGLICYATLVRSATLKLEKVAGTNQTIQIFRLLNAWNESQVTWNNRLTSTPWNTAGGDYNKDSLCAQQNSPVGTIFNWDMSTMLQKMVCNSTVYPNYGFEVRALCAGEPSSGCGNQTTTFATKENTTSGILIPTLQVTFDSAAFICAPIPVRPPLAMPDTASILSNGSVTLNVIANDQLPGANTGTISILAGSVTTGTATIVSNQINYTPNVTYQGLTTFQYIITDNITGLKDTANTFVYVSYPAPLAVDDSITINSGSSGSKNILTNDVDYVGLGVSYSVISNPRYGYITSSGSTLNYTAPFNFYGRDTVTYRLVNNATGYCNESNAADTAFFIIKVNNRAPNVANDSATTNPCQSVTLDVLQNDSDPEAGNISINSVSLVNPVAAGVASISGSRIIFIPNPAYLGSSATFTYTMQDDATPPAISSPATVTIHLNGNPANLSPLPVNDTISGLSNSASYINVMDNDSDPDNDSIYVTLTQPLLQPLHGSVTLMNNGLLKYSPNSNFTGTDVFEYRLSDSHQSMSAGSCIPTSANAVAKVRITIAQMFATLAQENLHLTVNRKNTGYELKWSVLEPAIPVTYFVERSYDGQNFESIEVVSQKNRYGGSNEYSLWVAELTNPNTFYRIRMRYADQQFLFSNIVEIMVKPSVNSMKVFPAPFQEKLIVSLVSDKRDVAKIKILNIQGSVIKEINAILNKGVNEIQLSNLESLPKGTYVIIAQFNDSFFLQKSVK
jgi:hypothetical protein